MVILHTTIAIHLTVATIITVTTVKTGMHGVILIRRIPVLIHGIQDGTRIIMAFTTTATTSI